MKDRVFDLLDNRHSVAVLRRQERSFASVVAIIVLAVGPILRGITGNEIYWGVWDLTFEYHRMNIVEELATYFIIIWELIYLLRMRRMDILFRQNVTDSERDSEVMFTKEGVTVQAAFAPKVIYAKNKISTIKYKELKNHLRVFVKLKKSDRKNFFLPGRGKLKILYLPKNERNRLVKTQIEASGLGIQASPKQQ